MRQLETLLEEYQGELAELEKAYHTFTDVVGNHFYTGNIVRSIQVEIIALSGKIDQKQSELDAHNAQFKGEREYDREIDINYDFHEGRGEDNYLL